MDDEFMDEEPFLDFERMKSLQPKKMEREDAVLLGMIRLVEDPTEAELEVMVKVRPEILEFVKNPSENIQMVAVKEYGRSIRYIDEPTDKVELIDDILSRDRDPDFSRFPEEFQEQLQERYDLAKTLWPNDRAAIADHMAQEVDRLRDPASAPKVEMAEELPDFDDFIIEESPVKV